MILSDYHAHTNFCDGINTPREMVLEGLNKGLKEIGLTVHSWTFFDESYCVKKSQIEKYIEEINSLKKEFDGRISVLCGVEQDYYSTMSTEGFDYAIGSVHYVLKDGKYLPVDESKQSLEGSVKKHFNGDYLAFCEEYFNTISALPSKHRVDVIGHFDLVAKFNKNNRLFDENSPRYIKAWKTAVDKLIPYGIPFEINTGVISRNYRKRPFVNKVIQKYILKCGGRFILSSDSHNKDTLCFGFDKIDNPGIMPLLAVNR